MGASVNDDRRQENNREYLDHWSRPLPYRFRFSEVIGKVIKLSDGSNSIWRLDPRDGGWSRDDDLAGIFDVEYDIGVLSPGPFVDYVETARAAAGVGDGRLRELYEDLLANYAELRDARPAGGPLVDLLHRRQELQLTTYRMFENELNRRGHPAAEPWVADLAERDPNWALRPC
jgi:hypothetical protein